MHIIDNSEANHFILSNEDYNKINNTRYTKPIYIDPMVIRSILDVDKEKKVYQTINDAIRNCFNYCPSPAELAECIKKDSKIKPIRVQEIQQNEGHYKYDLLEGRIRYWAWMIAFKGKEPIPVLVKI